MPKELTSATVRAMRNAPTLRDWLAEEPFGLTLSAGFFGFFAHAGLMLALEDAGLAPARLSGSSAGAMVSGFWASGRDAHSIRGLLSSVKREDFWDPGPGLGLLKGRLFRDLLERELGSRTFAGCRAPVAVSTFDVRGRRTVVHADGDLARAIHASCTFPGLFHPVAIDGRPHIDGGVLDRSGLTGMPEGGRVLYHHLSTRSRVRKHIRRLSLYPERAGMLPLILDGIPRSGPYQLDSGRAAMDVTHRAVARLLNEPIPTWTPGGSPLGAWLAGC